MSAPSEAPGKTLRFFATFLFAFAILSALQPLHAQVSPSAYTAATRYDLAGKITGTIAPDPDGAGPLKFSAMRNSYNDSGDLIRTEVGELASWQAETVAPSAWTGFTILRTVEITFSPLRQKLTELVKGSDGAGVSLIQFSYDKFRRLECTAVRMNPAVFASLPASACTLGTAGTQGQDRITRMMYDAAGQLLQVRKAVGTSLEQAYATYTYTANGKQQLIIDANGNKAQLEYDGFDRQTKWIFPSATALSPAAIASFNVVTPANAVTLAGAVNTADYEQYAYDANGNRTSLRKRDATTLTYTFDNLNRMRVKTVPTRANLPATHRRSVFYDYDLRGLMTSARFDSTTGEGIVTAYDGFGRITSSTISMDAQSRALTYQYDNNGNRTRVTFPENAANYAAYGFDGLNRPLTAGASLPAWSKTYAYNARGELITDTLSGSAGTTAWGRDLVGRLSSFDRDVTGTSSDITTTFAYSPASQTVSETRNNDAYVFAGRVNANRAYVTNGLNQYTQIAGNAYCHDTNGNLTADGISVYLYDIENRLVEKRAQGAGNTNCTALTYTGTLQARLRYDPMGRLYETSIGTAATTARFLIDGDAMVAEYDSVGAMLRRYVHGADGKADDPIAWYEGSAMNSNTLRLLHANQQGSITLTGDSAGNASRIFAYDEYGIPRAGDQAALTPANGARFLYTGQALVPELGMYYYKARIYAPLLGRFMQTDPIGYDDEMNLFAYVGNDPVNEVDPTGNGRLRYFVETASKVWKETTAKIARVASSQGKNIEVRGGNHQVRRETQRMASNNHGKGGTVRHDPHANIPSKFKGHHQSHVQPSPQTSPAQHYFEKVGAGLMVAVDVIDQLTDPLYAQSISPCSEAFACDSSGAVRSQRERQRIREENAPGGQPDIYYRDSSSRSGVRKPPDPKSKNQCFSNVHC